ncbi:MAG TPA: sigma-54 dependent transcriptional regulator [Polyangia bacterium]|nr:sigma-54 dependent transcriptional regulator [Polyangia bacterium]
MTVLIIDDEPAFRRMLETAVSAAGYRARVVASGEEALDLIAGDPPGLVFLDQRMGARSMTGVQTLEAIRAAHFDVPVVMVTAFGDVQTAVAAMKAGALDFLEKPLDLADLRRILREVLEPEAGIDDSQGRLAFGGIVPAGDAMQSALELLDAAARTDAPVLIAGESGTGKEHAAAFIIERSERRPGPFVKVNCAAIPAGLLEAEMFGCEPGAFTGATRSREGRFAAAEGGTLLLDEIAEMGTELQVKLLRVIQEKEYQPLGSSRTRRADVRILASTNRSIPEAIRCGAFREDLYFRLNVFEVLLPPLRERAADILPLARHLLTEVAGDRPRRISLEAGDLLLSHRWPGNVRELRNTIERAAILARGGVIRPEHLPPTVAAWERGATVEPRSAIPRAGTSVHAMERALIVETLVMTGGNRTRAAEALGLSRRALQYKLKRYGITG